MNWRDKAEIYSKYLISFLSRQVSLLWYHFSINWYILARDQTNVIISVLVGFTSLLYVILLILLGFFLLCFVFINILLVFSPMDPRKHSVLYILAARRQYRTELWGILFIFLSQNSKKSKEDCIYKRERKSKNIAIPVRMMAYFAFSLWASFLLLLLFFPLQLYFVCGQFCTISSRLQKVGKDGGEKKQEGKKKFDHDSIMLVGLLINLFSLSRCITLKWTASKNTTAMITLKVPTPPSTRGVNNSKNDRRPSTPALPAVRSPSVKTLLNTALTCCGIFSRWQQRGQRSLPFTACRLARSGEDRVLIDRSPGDLLHRSLIVRWWSCSGFWRLLKYRVVRK